MFEIIYNIIAAIYVVLLVFVFKRDLKSPINRYFILFFIGLLLWHVTLYLYLFVNLGDYLLFIGRLNYAAGPIFSLGLLGFFYYFPEENLKAPKWVKVAFWMVTIALAAISLFTPWVDAMETPTGTGPVVTLGDGYYYYLFYIFALPIITLVLGAIKNFTLKGLNKLRFEYSFWVFVPSIIAFLVSNAILPIFGIIDQFIWSPVFMLPIIVSSFYAIAKYRLLDIRMLLARAVAFVFFIFLCASIYTVVLFLIFQQTLGLKIDYVTAGVALAVAIFAALSFQPILRWLRFATNAIFYKGHYDREKLLGKLTHIMSQTINLELMTISILNLLMKEMHLSKGAFLVLEENGIGESFSRGYAKNDIMTKKFALALKKHILSERYRIFDELPENTVKKFMRDSDISIAIPIKVKNVAVAILILGPKLSGEIYDSQDIDFLNIFASESGIAIQNAKSYEQIKKFNIVLEKKVEERTHQLKKSQQRELAKARDVARLKDEFVFIASHELKAPVTAIRGFLELVTEQTASLPQNVQENLNYMSQASAHLNQLITDLLEISRSEEGTSQTTVQPTDIVPIVKTIIQEALPQANKENINIALHVDSKTAPAMADDKKLKEVIMNLVNNAIKYNRKGGKVKINVGTVKNKTNIDVKDTGYGIPKEEQKHIFEKFFRASNKKTEEVLGTGLGLFITRMIVEKMGGKISFTSEEGKGTTFTVSFPSASNSKK